MSNNETKFSPRTVAVIAGIIAFLIASAVHGHIPMVMEETKLATIEKGINWIAVWARIGVVLSVYLSTKKLTERYGNQIREELF